jgi:G:T-mismatch repair DNA endonuclease (very short patch repair protein)
MTTQSKEEGRQRTEMMAALRNQHSEAFKHAQAMLKEQQVACKSLQRAMLGGPKSVPQLAESTGIPTHVVLWHIAAMKKYGLVVEASLDENGDYFLYESSKEAKS